MTATLARDGAAPRWIRPGLPRKGWFNLDVEDMGEPCFQCELCGFPEVRYVHAMAHPRYDGVLSVGCICAGHLEENYAAAKDRERAARNRASRRARLIARHEICAAHWCEIERWKLTPKGNYTRRLRGVQLTVFPNKWRPGEWKSAIGDRFGTVSYRYPEHAFMGIFDRLFPLTRLLRDLESNGRRTIKLPGERGFR